MTSRDDILAQRTTIRRRTMLQELHNYDDDVHFRADSPLLAESGAVIWFDKDDLVVEHPGGYRTRHHGEWLEGKLGDSRLAFVVGRSEDVPMSRAVGVGNDKPPHGHIQRVQRELAWAWFRDTLGDRIGRPVRGKFVRGMMVEPEARFFELYLPGPRPEDALVVASVRVTKSLEVRDEWIDETALAEALKRASHSVER